MTRIVARFDLPPFRGAEGLDASAVADAIVASFEYFCSQPDPVATTFAEAAKAVDLAHTDSLYVAGNTIAAVMDKGIGVGHSDNYHSAKHCCEVLLCTLFLARLAALTPREQAQVVFCALVHDFHHDTHADGLNPFQQ